MKKRIIFFFIPVAAFCLVRFADAVRTEEEVGSDLLPKVMMPAERAPAKEKQNGNHRKVTNGRKALLSNEHEEEIPQQVEIPVVKELKSAIGVAAEDRQRREDCLKKCDAQKMIEVEICKRDNRCLAGALLNQRKCKETCAGSAETGSGSDIFSPFYEDRRPAGGRIPK
ncbi:MAG: hypothetical protein HY391_01545 [Deltaproteobacteria bacterium]|nr:hypothetical protein [Deltaproteobacteria bacterium]